MPTAMIMTPPMEKPTMMPITVPLNPLALSSEGTRDGAAEGALGKEAFERIEELTWVHSMDEWQWGRGVAAGILPGCGREGGGRTRRGGWTTSQIAVAGEFSSSRKKETKQQRGSAARSMLVVQTISGDTYRTVGELVATGARVGISLGD